MARWLGLVAVGAVTVLAAGCGAVKPSGPTMDGGCAPECAGRACGDDGCGGTCGACAQGASCTAQGQCVAGCVPACAGKVCGPDGCGGTCGACANGDTCSSDGAKCSGPQCTPACTGKTCGDDGCGGVCGGCAKDQTCTAGACVTTTCTPACGGGSTGTVRKQCGDDGCGGTCGTCPTSWVCGTTQLCAPPQVLNDQQLLRVLADAVGLATQKAPLDCRYEVFANNTNLTLPFRIVVDDLMGNACAGHADCPWDFSFLFDETPAGSPSHSNSMIAAYIGQLWALNRTDAMVGTSTQTKLVFEFSGFLTDELTLTRLAPPSGPATVQAIFQKYDHGGQLMMRISCPEVTMPIVD